MTQDARRTTVDSTGFGLADALCLLMALVWAANLSIAKDALVEIPPLAFNGLRMPIASLILILFVRLTGRSLAAPRAQWGRILLLGLIGNVAYQLFFMAGLHYTRAGNTGLLLACSAVWISLLSRFYGHEPVAARQWLAIGLSLTGVAVMLWESASVSLDPQALPGDLLILGATLCWAFFTVLSRPLLKTSSPLVVTTQTLAAGSWLLLLISLASIIRHDWAAVSTIAFLELAYATVFAISIAYTLWFVAVDRIGNTRTALYNNFVPLFGLLIATTFLGESITALQTAGGGMILTAVVLARSGSRL